MSAIDAIELNTALILVKAESTYGTDPLPVETDALMVRNFKAEPVINMINKPRVRHLRPSFGKNVGSIHWKISFECDVTGPSDPDAAQPQIGPLLEACEMVRADVGAAPVTGHTYKYQTRAAQPSITIYLVQFRVGSSTHKITPFTGVKLTHKLTAGVDEPCIFSFEGLGIYNDETTGALTLGSIDYGDTLEVSDASNGKGMVVTYGGTSQIITKLELTSNRTVEPIKSVTAASGIQEFDVTAPMDGNIMIKMNPPEPVTVAGDHWEQLVAESQAAVAIQVDTVQGVRFSVAASAVQRGSWTRQEDSPIWRLDNEFLVHQGDADEDGLTYTFALTP